MNAGEKITVSKMLLIYCRSKHGNEQELCSQCSALESYAHQRLEHCTFGEKKPICKRCPIHCYKPDYRSKIKEVMRFSGPRMILYHPFDVFKHLIHKSKK